MSKKVNPAAVGIFVALAVIILLAALIMLGAGELFEKKGRFLVYFEGSANGLDVGSDVLLGGVKVGGVESMRVQIDENKDIVDGEEVKSYKKLIAVVIELSADRIAEISEEHTRDEVLDQVPVFVKEKNLRARLMSKSVLTGQLYVDLDLFPNEKPGDAFTFQGEPGKGLEKLPQIPSTKNEIQRVLQSIAEGVEKISNIDADDVIADAKEAIKKIREAAEGIAEIDYKGIGETAKSTLAKADSAIGKIDELIGDEKIQSTIASIDEAARELKDLLAAIDGEAVNGAVVGAEETIKEAGEAVKTAGDALKKIELAAGNIADNTSPDAALTVRLNRTLGAIDEVARSIAELTDYLKRNPNSILSGKKRP